MWRDIQAEWTSPDIALATLDLPSVSGVGSLLADARAVVDACRDLAGPLVLLGHSYGGAVVTQASLAISDLAGVVYLAAFRPHLHESVTAASRRATSPNDLDPTLAWSDGALVLTSGSAHALFDDPHGRLALDCLASAHRQPLETFREELSSDVPHGVWTHYIVCEHDRTIPRELQMEMAGVCSDQSSLPTGHCPQVDDPRGTAQHVRSVVEVTLSRTR